MKPYRPLLARILWLLLPSRVRDPLIGDLDEEYRRYIEPRNPQGEARRWYRRQIWRTLAFTPSLWRREYPVNRTGGQKVKSAEGIVNDLRYALRQLRRSPGFLATAVLTLAIGIGANVAIFSVVNRVLLQPLDYDPDGRLVTMIERQGQDGPPNSSVSFPNFADWEERNRVFDSMAAYNDDAVTLSGAGQAERIDLVRVTPDFFKVLGTGVTIGRTFSESDAGESLAVIGDGLFERLFGADPAAIGQTLLLDAEGYQIVGVAPAGFSFPTDTDVWVPLPVVTSQARRNMQYKTVARLGDGVGLEQARADMIRLSEELEREYPQANGDWRVHVESLHSQFVGDLRPALLVLFGAVGLVLLIACANVANMMLARATTRQPEFALRVALGARRGTLLRGFFVESVLLAGIGAVLGMPLAYVGVRVLVTLAPSGIGTLDGLAIDPGLLIFTLLVTTLTTLLFGLMPALQASKQNLADTLKTEGRAYFNRQRRRLFGVVVVSEVALCFTLLVASGLFLGSLRNLQAVDTGFGIDDKLTFRVSLPMTLYDRPGTREFHDRLLDEIRSIASVESAAAMHVVPLSGDNQFVAIAREGEPFFTPDGRFEGANYRRVSSDIHRVLGIPLRSGRLFSDADQGADVVIVNETMAERTWPGQDPVGRRILVPMDTESPLRVVGVVGDTRDASPGAAPRSTIYVPYGWGNFPARSMAYVVKTRVPPETVAPQLMDAVNRIDPGIVPYRIETMDQMYQRSTGQPRFMATLLGVFAGVALVLAIVGLYGVASYAVGQRTPEIGTRMALGAVPSDILVLVLRYGIGFALMGIVLGFAGAVTLTRVLADQLFGMEAADPATLSMTAVIVLTVSTLAVAVPGLRAARIDPVRALRHD